jgi:hypothetical protein
MVVRFSAIVTNIPDAMASAIRVETNPVYGFYGLMTDMPVGGTVYQFTIFIRCRHQCFGNN